MAVLSMKVREGGALEREGAGAEYSCLTVLLEPVYGT